jgi:hypothetical protein
MIRNEFDLEGIQSIDFGVSLLDGTNRIVPVDSGVKSSITEMLSETVRILVSRSGDWEEYSPSEEYGKSYRLFCPRNKDYALEFSNFFEAADFPDGFDISQASRDIRFYFSIFRDGQDRKLIAIKRATAFKGTLGARNRLVAFIDNTLKIIEEEVFRLDLSFDILLCDQNIFIADSDSFVSIGDLQEVLIAAAERKLEAIQASVPFLDLSGVASDIQNHPRTARLVASVAERGDLETLDKEKIVALAAAHGLSLIEDRDGKLRPRAGQRHAFMEVLDDRRYLSNLTTRPPVPYRARSKQRVTAA